MLSRNDRKQAAKGTLRRIWKFAVLLTTIIFVLILLSQIVLTVAPVKRAIDKNPLSIINQPGNYPEIFKRDHNLLWRLRPSNEFKSPSGGSLIYRINALGMRGAMPSPTSHAVRIVALGNSVTFGWGVDEDSTFETQLRQMINKDPALPQVEVINAGIPGYSSFQGRRYYVEEISKLHPDILMVMFGWGDQMPAKDSIPDDKLQMPSESIIHLENFLDRIKLYSLIQNWLHSNTMDSSLNSRSSVRRVSIVNFYDNLNTIIKYAESESTAVILLTSPAPAPDRYNLTGNLSLIFLYHEYYNYQTRLAARNNQVPLIDVAQQFNKYDSLFDDAAHDPIHFNAAGHRTIAAALYNYLKTNSQLLTK
ncbi:conserved hypothetical protein [Candidatus Zixiibacteriota bacterium]|nr:conserved hypothetical protein [candidate division Zixibacteria bacterium]